ncbi:peroxisomal biogenesis factor 19 [Sporobolomyces koalae]|uniref:peroxisomal biogenesis factor 19 n=1 Tax=Sporobolomyces koalae TaxID=500713 RepID=UPI003179069C
MAPPTIHDDTEDLDDLDDVLDQFSATRTPAPSSGQSATASSTAIPPQHPSHPSPASFPDPDDDELAPPNDDDDDLAGLDPAATKDLEQGMKALFDALGAGGAASDGAIPGLDGEDDGDFDEEEFRKAMEEIIKTGGAGAGAGVDGAGAVDPNELQQLMAALGMGSFSTGSQPTTAPPKPTSNAPAASAKGKDKAVPNASSSSAPPPPSAAPANFQDAIAASLSKMQASSTDAAAAAQQSQTSGGSANLASMLAGLSGMPDLDQLGDLGGEEGLQGMLDEMMKQLMSREMLYEPLKELSEKYPAYLTSARSSLSAEDLERYERQQSIVVSIVSKFEEPGADKPVDQQSPAEKERSEERTEQVVELVAKMNECGAPPKEIMGDMPPGMELGPDGAPKIPECTIC